MRARNLVEGSQGIENQAFMTYFIAHASTGVTTSKQFPKDIAGKVFTFGSKGSTSGRLMPEFYLRENIGKGPNETFKKVGYSGNHSKTVALVQSGAVNFQVWERELK